MHRSIFLATGRHIGYIDGIALVLRLSAWVHFPRMTNPEDFMSALFARIFRRSDIVATTPRRLTDPRVTAALRLFGG